MVHEPRHRQVCFNIVVFFFCMVLCASSFTAAGQLLPAYPKEDSIARLLKTSRPDSNRVKLLHRLSAAWLSEAELSEAAFAALFKHLGEAAALCDSLQLPFTAWKANTLRLMGEAFIRHKNVAKGKSIFMELVKRARDAGDRKEEAGCWSGYADALAKEREINAFVHDIETSFRNAMVIYGEIKEAKRELDMILRLATFYYRINDFNKLNQQLVAAIPKSEAAGLYQLSRIYSLLSLENRYSGNYNKALGYALRSVKAMEDSKDSIRADVAYGELGEVYQALGKPVESVIWYKKCLAKREVLPGYPAFYLYRTYGLLIMQLIKCGAQKEALATIQDLRQRKPPHVAEERAVLYQCMAYCYDAGNEYDSAGKYFLKMVESFNEANKTAIIADEIILLAYYDIAEFYVRRWRYSKARPYLEMIMQDMQSVNISKVADVQLLLFKVDSACGNYPAAIKHIQQYKLLTDSITNEIKNREIEQLQIEYETDKKDQEIKLLLKKDQLQQANLRQANIIRNWIAASTVLLALLLIAGYTRYRFKQRTNKKLEAQQVVINHKNVSLQRLVHEKEWLIKEIHHRVKNNFHIVMGLLGTQSGYLKNDEAIAAVKESRQRIHAMSLLHLKLFQSESLSTIDIREYIYELVDSLKESFDQSASIQFHLEVERMHLELPHVMPVGLILNEAITNVFKHAFPGKGQGNIYISLVYDSGCSGIVLTIADDGAGLPADFSYNNRSTMGLNLMKGLSDDIDGHFTMESNNGTTVRVSFIYSPDQDMPDTSTPG